MKHLIEKVNEARPASITLHQLQNMLREIEKQSDPNAEVFIASDSEGNSFGTINSGHSFEWDKKRLVIYPHSEGIDFNDIELDIPERKKLHEGISITIDTDNDAFQPDPGYELARILRKLADRLERGEDAYGPLADVNGNKVGKVMEA